MATSQRNQLRWLALLPLSLILYACGNSPNVGSMAVDSPEAIPCERGAGGRGGDGKLCAMPPDGGHGGHGTAAAGADHGDHAMDLGPAGDSYDLRFIDAMILHHEGAVTMAEAALDYSQRPEVRQLAEEIIAAQAVEIDQMQQWRQDWYPNASPEPIMYHAAMGHDMAMSGEMAAAMRMDLDLGTADDEFDRRFIDAMIPHHEGALVMAQEAQAKSSRAEMQTLAEAILATQQVEIDQMQQWRKDWYGQ